MQGEGGRAKVKDDGVEGVSGLETKGKGYLVKIFQVKVEFTNLFLTL